MIFRSRILVNHMLNVRYKLDGSIRLQLSENRCNRQRPHYTSEAAGHESFSCGRSVVGRIRSFRLTYAGRIGIANHGFCRLVAKLERFRPFELPAHSAGIEASELAVTVYLALLLALPPFGEDVVFGGGGRRRRCRIVVTRLEELGAFEEVALTALDKAPRKAILVRLARRSAGGRHGGDHASQRDEIGRNSD